MKGKTRELFSPPRFFIFGGYNHPRMQQYTAQQLYKFIESKLEYSYPVNTFLKSSTINYRYTSFINMIFQLIQAESCLN